MCSQFYHPAAEFTQFSFLPATVSSYASKRRRAPRFDYGGNGPSTIQGQSAIPGDSMLLRKGGSPLRARRAGGGSEPLTYVLLALRALAGAWGTGTVWVIWALAALLGTGVPVARWTGPWSPCPTLVATTFPPNPSSPGGWSWVGELDFCRGGVFTVGWDLGECGLLSACF